MSEGNENTAKLIGAFVLGAAIGAALGILLAPEKGSETRKKILENGKDLADDITQKVKEGIDELKKGFDEWGNEKPA